MPTPAVPCSAISDRLGGANASWNAVHLSAGCSQESLVKTGGAGMFYCFAAQ